MFTTFSFLWTWITVQAHETSHKVARDERGQGVLEWVLIVAGVAIIALAAVAIIKNTVLDKANSIPTN